MNSQLLFINPPLLPPDECLDVEEEIIRVKATFEQYLLFSLREEPKKVEYSNGYITYMSYPTDKHEQIILNLGWVYNDLFFDDPDFIIYGSNLGILIQATGASYKPDCVALTEKAIYVKHKVGRNTLKSVINPFAVFEIFSDSTMEYDVDEKLPNFKACPSLRYIIFIHQHKPLVTVHFRKDALAPWQRQDYEGLSAGFTFFGKNVPLRRIYHKVIFFGS